MITIGGMKRLLLLPHRPAYAPFSPWISLVFLRGAAIINDRIAAYLLIRVVIVLQKQEIFNFMNQNPVFQLATLDGEFPRVRTMLLFRADQNGILFHTGTVKDVYGQILQNPHVEMCFTSSDGGTQVRVRGTLQIVDDITLKDEITNHPTRQFLQGWKRSGPLQDFYNAFIVFKMTDGKAVTWTMATNFAPKEEVSLF